MESVYLIALGTLVLDLVALLAVWLFSRNVAGKRENRLASLDADVRSMLSALAAQPYESKSKTGR